MNTPNITLEVIKVSNLSAKDKTTLEDAIKKELTLSELPATLQFVISDLPLKDFQNSTIGRLSTLVSTLNANSSTSANDIYYLLMDELDKKGREKFDFEKWEDTLKRKALTYTTVDRVIKQFTMKRDDSERVNRFKEITLEVEPKVMKRDLLKPAYERYSLQRLSPDNLSRIETTSSILESIERNYPAANGNIVDLIELVKKDIPENIKTHLIDETGLTAAIICEYINRY